MKQKYFSSTKFPTQLLDDVDKLNLSSKDRDKVITFLVTLKRKSIELTDKNDSFVEVPRNYMIKVFGEKYYTKYISKMLELDILKVTNSYSYGNINKEDNYCKRYSFNSKYYYLVYMCSDFEAKYCKSTKYAFKTDLKAESEKEVQIPISTVEEVLISNVEEIKKERKKRKPLKAVKTKIEVDRITEQPTIINLKSSKIDFKILRNLVYEGIDKSLSRFKYLINEQITTKYFKTIFLRTEKRYFSYNKKCNESYRMKLLSARNIASREGLDLIEYKGKLYIMKEEHFLNMRRNAMIDSCNSAIDELESRAFRAVRSDVNGRLNTNITNLPSFLTDEIMRQNNLVQLDLANSQFAIFAHLFQEQLGAFEDFQVFAKHAQQGNLYELIQKSLGLTSRDEAKQTMFELMFSVASKKSDLKDKLKSVFPNVVAAVDSYKRKHGYNMFAILLQRKESEIFIDGLLTNFVKKNMYCLTKHDSVIVKKKDAEKAKKMIEDYLYKIEFKGTIK